MADQRPKTGGIETVFPARAKTYVDTLEALRNQSLGIPMAPDMSRVRTRRGELAEYLGTPDYAARDKEATDLAKLQFYLAMAQRGFAGMGAAPQRGESSLAALGRTVASPLAQDMSTIAGQLMPQRAAIKAAREQEERQLKLAAFQQIQTEDAAYRDLAEKLMPDPAKDTLLSNLVQNVNVPLTYKKNGETITEYVPANVNVSRNKQNTFRQITLLGEVTTPKGETFPAGFLVPSFSKITEDGETRKQGTRGHARRLDAKDKPTGPIFPVNYDYKDGKYAFWGIGTKDTTPVIVEGAGKNAVLVSETTGEPFAPAAGTEPAFSGNFVLTDDSGKGIKDDKGVLIQLRQRGAGLVTPDGQPYIRKPNEIAEPLTSYIARVRKPPEDDAQQWENIKFVSKMTPTGLAFTNPTNPMQVRQEKVADQPIDIRTLKPYQLQPGEILATYEQLSDTQKGVVSKTSDAYKDNLVVWNTKTNKAVVDSEGRRVQVRLKGNKPYQIGFETPYRQPKDTKLVSLSKLDAQGPGPTPEDQKRADRLALLFNRMNEIQVSKVGGKFSAYNKNSAFYFDQSAYINGDFPFKYVPPGTDPADRTKDVIITNKKIQKLIKNKMDSLAQTSLKKDFGEAKVEVQSERVAKAVRSILSLPASTVFGAGAIANIGTDGSGNTVGYVPTPAAVSRGVVNDNVKTAFATMREKPDANARETFAPLPVPDNEADLNKTWGRIRTASEHFPDAFESAGQPGTDSFDEARVQERSDIEDAVRTARLLIRADSQDHRAVIQDGAIKLSDARKKAQDSRDAYSTDVGHLLDFRKALLDFKNAAAESNVEGFFTGTFAATAAQLGFAKFIAGEGAEAWSRLTQASNRLAHGFSRRVGREFGDQRISNWDAASYQKLLANIKKGKNYNKYLVSDGLKQINTDLGRFMQMGGKAYYSKNLLNEVAEAGVDFSDLKTQLGWHGHGYYGENRYQSTRQKMPSLSPAARNAIRGKGELKATLYGGKYTVPVGVSYMTDNLPRFTMGREKTATSPEIKATKIKRMGPREFEVYMKNYAEAAGVSPEEMRKRIVRGIQSYSMWRDTQ